MLFKFAGNINLRNAWLLAGYMLVMLVVYLSLTSRAFDIALNFASRDKLYHFIAYFTLMVWFAYVYHAKSARYLIALAFICLGVLLEYLQSFSPYRLFEYDDMLANIIGVVAGFVVMLRRGEVRWLKG